MQIDEVALRRRGSNNPIQMKADNAAADQMKSQLMECDQ